MHLTWLPEVRLGDLLLFLGGVVGAIGAVQLEKWLERRRVQRQAKLYIFKTLMATQAAFVSHDHVRALNMIELEFYTGGDRERAVVTAWRAYHDHLKQQTTKETEGAWGQKRVDSFVDLLYAMAQCLGYDRFSKTEIRNAWYAPKAHEQLEGEQQRFRTAVLELLEVPNKRTLPVVLVEPAKPK